MGCDIHLHVEIKSGGQWYHYDHPNIRRNYWLFSKMAGVRNVDGKVEPISSPKGLPLNISFTTKMDFGQWGTDAHSMSWLSSDEVVTLAKWIRKSFTEHFMPFDHEFDFLFGNTYEGFKKYKEDYPNQLEDFRFVFWFDN